MSEDAKKQRTPVPFNQRLSLKGPEAADMLSISESKFSRYVQRGVLPKPTKLGGNSLWDRRDLEAAWDEVRRNGGVG